jgi:hypothetical protein
MFNAIERYIDASGPIPEGDNERIVITKRIKKNVISFS